MESITVRRATSTTLTLAAAPSVRYEPPVRTERDTNRLGLPVADRELGDHAVAGDVDDGDVAPRLGRHPDAGAVGGEGDGAGVVAHVQRVQQAPRLGVEHGHGVVRLCGDVELGAVARDRHAFGLDGTKLYVTAE